MDGGIRKDLPIRDFWTYLLQGLKTPSNMPHRSPHFTLYISQKGPWYFTMVSFHTLPWKSMLVSEQKPALSKFSITRGKSKVIDMGGLEHTDTERVPNPSWVVMGSTPP